MVRCGAYFLEQHAADLMSHVRNEEPGNRGVVQFVLRLVGLSLGTDHDTHSDWPKPLWYGSRG
jgi:hypothetical protein